MGYLKSLWLRKYQFLVMSEEGGWTKSYLVKFGHIAIALSFLALIIIGLDIIPGAHRRLLSAPGGEATAAELP